MALTLKNMERKGIKKKVGGAGATIITDQNIKNVVNAYFFDKSKLPEDLQNVLIGKWNVSRVTDMRELFYNDSDKTYEFGEADSLDEWDVSRVGDMTYMFRECHYNHPLNSWNVEKVENFKGTFYNSDFNQALDNWKPVSAKNMNGMFYGCSYFNQLLDSWGPHLSKVKNMNYMFHGCHSFEQDLADWDVDKVSYFDGIFDECPIKPYHMPMKFRRLRYRPAPASALLQQPETLEEPPEIKPRQEPVQQVQEQELVKPLGSIEQPIHIAEDAAIFDIDNAREVTLTAPTTFLKMYLEDEDNILFLQEKKYHVTSREKLKELIDTRKKDNSIVFICKEPGIAINITANLLRSETPYLRLNSIGLLYGYIEVSQIQQIIKDKDKNQLYVLSYANEEAPTVVSWEMYNFPTGEAAVSASHCQEGHGGKIYNAQIGKIDETQRGGGITRRHKRKQKQKQKQTKKENVKKRRREGREGRKKKTIKSRIIIY